MSDKRDQDDSCILEGPVIALAIVAPARRIIYVYMLYKASNKDGTHMKGDLKATLSPSAST